MITPGGANCPFYYEDFQRGANRQECRIAKMPNSAEWRPTDCAGCPVPAIVVANGSPTLGLRIGIARRRRRGGRRIEAEAWCSLHGPTIADPIVGCPECNAEADELLKRAFD